MVEKLASAFCEQGIEKTAPGIPVPKVLVLHFVKQALKTAKLPSQRWKGLLLHFGEAGIENRKTGFLVPIQDKQQWRGSRAWK